MRLIVFGLLAGLLGCAGGGGEVPESRLYMLRAAVPAAIPDSDFVVGLDAVQLASYLKRSELVLQVGPQELRPARYHRWAEPLDQNIRRYLRDRLSAEVSVDVDANSRRRDRWDLQISLAVEEFHGTLEGQVLLTASWDVERLHDTAHVVRGRARLTESQSRDGYAALVDAKSRLLDKLAQRVATDLKAVIEED